MKKGDKFLCKKTNKGHDNDIGVEKNVWYEVVKMDFLPKDLTSLTYSDYDIPKYVQVNDGKSVFNITFCVTHYNNNSDYIWNYFYTEKELRKKKLDKINDYK